MTYIKLEDAVKAVHATIFDLCMKDKNTCAGDYSAHSLEALRALPTVDVDDAMVERAGKALGDSLNSRPYGGYDYGHNEAFYGPAPEAGRYVVRCERTNEIVHQTKDCLAHDAAYQRLTNAFHARAALTAALAPPS